MVNHKDERNQMSIYNREGLWLRILISSFVFTVGCASNSNLSSEQQTSINTQAETLVKIIEFIMI